MHENLFYFRNSTFICDILGIFSQILKLIYQKEDTLQILASTLFIFKAYSLFKTFGRVDKNLQFKGVSSHLLELLKLQL